MPTGSREAFHTLEMSEIAFPRHPAEHAHRRRRLADQHGAAETSMLVTHPHRDHERRYEPRQSRRRDVDPVCRRVARNQLIDHVTQRRIDHRPECVASALSICKDETPQRPKRLDPQVGRRQPELPAHAHAQRFTREDVVTDRDRPETTTDPVDPQRASVVGHIDEPPARVEDPSSLARRLHRQHHLGQQRIGRPRTRFVGTHPHRRTLQVPQHHQRRRAPAPGRSRHVRRAAES